jgi:hypothetical protein
MNLAFSLFDRLVFGTILDSPTGEEIATIKLIASDQTQNDENKNRQYIYRMLDAIDTKVSGMLTHISLLIAALVFIYSSLIDKGGNVFFKIVIMTEICAYLILTIFCLRAIRMTSKLSNAKSEAAADALAIESDALALEFYKRRTAYNWTSNMTVFVTTFTILTLVLGGICNG